MMQKVAGREERGIMNSLTETALDMATQDIKFNRLFFKRRTTLAEAREIFDMCLKVARMVDEREKEREERQVITMRPANKSGYT
jgi:hypothetical protein